MAVPGLPLPSPITVGYQPHNDLHTDANDALNYLGSDSQSAALVFASPAAAPGAGDYITLAAEHIAAALAALAVGAAGTPTIAFTGDPDTGLYWVSADNFGIAAGGVLVASVQLSGTNRQVIIGDGTNGAKLLINGAGNSRDVLYQTGGLNRWNTRATGTTESGGDTGSNFVLISYDDAGAMLNGNVLTAERSTGRVCINRTPIAAPARFTVDGSVDEVQVIVQAHSTQTSNLEEWQTSAGGVLVKIGGQGLFFPAQFTTAGRPAWAAGLVGSLYFDTTANKLYVAGAAAWEQVTSV